MIRRTMNLLRKYLQTISLLEANYLVLMMNSLTIGVKQQVVVAIQKTIPVQMTTAVQMGIVIRVVVIRVVVITIQKMRLGKQLRRQKQRKR